MTEYTSSPTYRRCQTLFDRVYPDFRDAGCIYRDAIAQRVSGTTRVLDLGCGHDSLAADELEGAALTAGIDLDRVSLAANDAVRYPIEANAEELPFAGGAFDLIVSEWALEHFPNPGFVFGEIRRLLKNGGEAVIFTTNANNYVPLLSRLVPARIQSRALRRLLRRPEHESFQTYYRANTGRALARLARDAGLRLTNVLYVGNPFYLAFSLSVFAFGLLFEKMTDMAPVRCLKLYMVIHLEKRTLTSQPPHSQRA